MGTLRVLLCLAMAAVACGAHAQTRYQCNTNGVAYLSDRPCSQSRAVYYGPTERPVSPHIPGIGEAPAQAKYMSPRCSSLNDALRTAAVRGLRSETVAEMRKNYRLECGEDESEAAGKLSEERKEKGLQRKAERSASKQEQDRAALQEQQCAESKRILVTKRSRTDLTEGEKAELRRFEANYRGRCTVG